MFRSFTIEMLHRLMNDEEDKLVLEALIEKYKNEIHISRHTCMESLPPTPIPSVPTIVKKKRGHGPRFVIQQSFT